MEVRLVGSSVALAGTGRGVGDARAGKAVVELAHLTGRRLVAEHLEHFVFYKPVYQPYFRHTQR